MEMTADSAPNQGKANEQFQDLSGRLLAELALMRKQMDDQFTKMDGRFTEMDGRFSDKFTKMDDQLTDLQESLQRVTIRLDDLERTAHLEKIEQDPRVLPPPARHTHRAVRFNSVSGPRYR